MDDKTKIKNECIVLVLNNFALLIFLEKEHSKR